MKIVQIIPGSGGSFYCGNCLRDDKFYESLKRLGHDVIKIPMYLPLFADEHAESDKEVPVFYGAVSLYLKQQFPFLRKFPKAFDRLMNSSPMLRLAARQSGSTDASGLEDMTISMLKGEEGNQSNELEEMVSWIENHYKPDVVHISNALLLGLAKKLKDRLQVPVLCSLQDEDVWVDAMDTEHRDMVWALMAEKAKNVDAFIAVSDYFAALTMDRMHISHEKMHRVYLGVLPENYRYINVAEKKRNIGFISRLCVGNGLDILVDAFIGLKKKEGYEDVKLILTGGYTHADRKYIKSVKTSIHKAGLSAEVEFLEKFDDEDRLAFFDRISLLSVPVRKGEAFGIYLTEALASGVPIVQPALGAFPEIVKGSQGGIVYNPNTPEKLQQKLEEMLDKDYDLKQLSVNGRRGVELEFNIQKQSEKLVDVYKKYIK
jgi:glycosyltransferase involved in cell wall biosynthesis